MWEKITEHGLAKKTWKRKVSEEPVPLQGGQNQYWFLLWICILNKLNLCKC